MTIPFGARARLIWSRVLVCIQLSIATLMGQGIPVAVLDFDGVGISQPEAIALSNRLRNELFKLGTFNVVDRGMMETIMSEQDFQTTGCTSNDCLVEVGRLIGAQQMVGGSVSKVGDTYSVSCRLVDVETGKIIGVSDYDRSGKLDDMLTKGMRIVALMLAGRTEEAETLAAIARSSAPVIQQQPRIVQRQPVQPQVQQSAFGNAQIMMFYESQKKNPMTASLISCILPTAGHAYAGNWGRGVVFFLGRVGLITMAVTLGFDEVEEDYYTDYYGNTYSDYYYEPNGLFYVGYLGSFVLGIWEIIDAGSEVKRYNAKLYNRLLTGQPSFGLKLAPTPDGSGAGLELTYNF